MELHTVCRLVTMRQCHDLTVFRARRHHEGGWTRIVNFHDERMVPPDTNWRRLPFE